AIRSVRASCPDSRAKHPCFACRDPRPPVRGSPLLLARCFDTCPKRCQRRAMVVPGRGLRRAAHGCAAAASQPWMADRAEEQPPARDDSNRRREPTHSNPTDPLREEPKRRPDITRPPPPSRSVGRRAQAATACERSNWASSVEPVSAVTLELPPWIT